MQHEPYTQNSNLNMLVNNLNNIDTMRQHIPKSFSAKSPVNI